MTQNDPIKPTGVLITGGSEGIGRALAARYLAAGSQVLVTGRSAQKLETAKHDLPGLQTLLNDIGRPDEREAVARHVEAHMPKLNVVINNAGIQRRVSLAADTGPWAERQAEIDILLAGPVHLKSSAHPINAALEPTRLDRERDLWRRICSTGVRSDL